MSKYQAALTIKNAIETTEQHSLYTPHTKSLTDFYERQYIQPRTKRAYQNAK